MAKNNLLKVFCFDVELGALGWDADRAVSFFQFHPDFLANQAYQQLIPSTGILRRVKEVQVFKQYQGDTFRGLPPIFADSLPDIFGNVVFKAWLENTHKDFKQLSVIEQLAYVADRGMGALTYQPKKAIPSAGSIQLTEIVEVLQSVLDLKQKTKQDALNHAALLNIFKMGTSAGGARPKLLIAQNKADGSIQPGDLPVGAEFAHYLVKLNLKAEAAYPRELVEYSYYLTATHCGIRMMPSKMIDGGHFATERFDRIDGQKIHVLTATGLTGWDFKDPRPSSYENLFDLGLFLKLPHAQIEELFKRMVFNVVFANHDDHLKNHSFVYQPLTDSWQLAPAYDLTYSLHPLVNFKKSARALSINGKRTHIERHDLQQFAHTYTIKNFHATVAEVVGSIDFWRGQAEALGLPPQIIERIMQNFNRLQ